MFYRFIMIGIYCLTWFLLFLISWFVRFFNLRCVFAVCLFEFCVPYCVCIFELVFVCAFDLLCDWLLGCYCVSFIVVFVLLFCFAGQFIVCCLVVYFVLWFTCAYFCLVWLVWLTFLIFCVGLVVFVLCYVVDFCCAGMLIWCCVCSGCADLLFVYWDCLCLVVVGWFEFPVFKLFVVFYCLVGFKLLTLLFGLCCCWLVLCLILWGCLRVFDYWWAIDCWLVWLLVGLVVLLFVAFWPHYLLSLPRGWRSFC